MSDTNFHIHKQPFGEYQTHCYILQNPHGELIIDPGMGATQWVKKICKNPLAILNTHGHFDHIWSNKELQETFTNIPLVVHKEDAFMLQEDCFNLNLPLSRPTQLITKTKETLHFGDFTITYHHFPGHTPGCCMIETATCFFSGDFIFYRSIGRYDFPYSSPKSMQESLLRFKEIKSNKILYPGHGEPTTIAAEQENLHFWLHRF